MPAVQGVFWAGAVLLFVPVMYHTKMADHAMPADVFEGEPHVLEVQLPSAPQHSPSLGRSSGNGSSMSAAALGGPVVAAQLDMGGRVQLLAFCGFEVRSGGKGGTCEHGSLGARGLALLFHGLAAVLLQVALPLIVDSAQPHSHPQCLSMGLLGFTHQTPLQRMHPAPAPRC